METGLNIDELYEIGANSIVECILSDCEFYGIETVDYENIRLSRVIIDDENSMLVEFEVWNGKEWEDANIPYPFYKIENEELFLEVLEEIENISELKPNSNIFIIKYKS